MAIHAYDPPPIQRRYRTWLEKASCKGLPPSLFFLTGRRSLSFLTRRLCIDCPVRMQCMADGWEEEYGVWGGLIPEDRVVLQSILPGVHPRNLPSDERTEVFNEVVWGLDIMVKQRCSKHRWKTVEEIKKYLINIGHKYLDAK